MSLVGNLEDLGLGEILQIVSLSRKSGVLTLRSRGREGMVVFRSGQVIKAYSSTFRSSLGEVLVERGVVDAPRLRQALRLQEDEGYRERLGIILVQRFSVSTDIIEEIVREQIEKVVYSLFAWEDGTFDFELQDNIEAVDDIKMDPLQFMLEQGLNPQFLAMEGSRIIDERRHRGESLEEDVPLPESAPADDGVDFAFDLMQAPVVEPPPPPVATAVPPAVAPPVEKPRLVLVDDEAVLRDALVPLLEGSGFAVSAFAKGEDALILVDALHAKGVQPTLLFDLIMPRMDGTGILGGLELLEMVRESFPGLPAAVMADYRNAEAERQVQQLGAAFLLKPRSAELDDPDRLGRFHEELLRELSTPPPTLATPVPAPVDPFNLGDALRLEIGDEPAPAPGAPADVSSTGLALLREMLEELNNPALGGGIILLVLRFAAEFMDRAVIFLVKREEIAGLGQFGIEDPEGLADARVRTLRLRREEDTLFAPVIEARIPLKVRPEPSASNRYLFGQLHGSPQEVFLGPLVSEGKVVAILYGDNYPDNRPLGDTDTLEIFLSQAGLAMERILLQRRLQEKGVEGV